MFWRLCDAKWAVTWCPVSCRRVCNREEAVNSAGAKGAVKGLREEAHDGFTRAATLRTRHRELELKDHKLRSYREAYQPYSAGAPHLSSATRAIISQRSSFRSSSRQLHTDKASPTLTISATVTEHPMLLRTSAGKQNAGCMSSGSCHARAGHSSRLCACQQPSRPRRGGPPERDLPAHGRSDRYA